MTHATYITAPNDVNGNPRRGYLITEDNCETYFEAEGYAGMSGILQHRGQYLRAALDAAPHVKVTATEYRRLVKQYR
jgi:hypothetical protein